MAEPALPERQAVRRSFERAAGGYDEAAHLQREIGTRLLAHLDPMRVEPRTILDLGCGTGSTFAALRKRFPSASLLGLDLSLNMLKVARARTPWWQRAMGKAAAPLVCADAERIPLAARSAQLVFSNLALQWCRPESVFEETARVLAEGGLLLFSTFGPDTLKELRAAFAAVDRESHVNTFPDMHDLGDALVHAGYADPVMEMEILTVEYASVEAVARDLKAVGAHNVLPGRPRGLSGRRRWNAMVENYERFRRAGAYPATYEVVYGHAWKAAARRTADGRQVIDFRPRGNP